MTEPETHKTRSSEVEIEIMVRDSHFQPGLIFVGLAAMSLLFWWHSLMNAFALAATNEAYTHILLVLPLGAALAYLDLKDGNLSPKGRHLDGLPGDQRNSLLFGTPLLALAVLVGGYAQWGLLRTPDDIRLSLAVSALVVWWIASVAACFGFRAIRALLLPLGFLFFLVPVPESALTTVVTFLQHGSAWMAASLFHAVGEPVQRDGIFLNLKLSGLNIEVAQECSSIRSSCFLVITTIVLAHLFLRSGWRKMLLVLIAIPLSIAKNGLRIFVIAELGTRVDSGFLDGNFHHHGGIVFLLVALAVIAMILYILHRGESHIPLLSAAAK
jgi:exosortase